MSLLKYISYGVGLAVVSLSALANAASDYLVSTEWLEKNLNDKNLRILEVSVEPGQFERGHIPNASNIVWHSDLVDTVARDIASRENFEKCCAAPVLIRIPPLFYTATTTTGLPPGAPGYLMYTA